MQNFKVKNIQKHKFSIQKASVQKFALMYKTLITCILFTLLGIPSIAQKYSLPFRKYTSDEGLSNDNVYDITKDKKGQLWIATDFGISKFDGKNFESILLGDGAYDNTVSAIEAQNDLIYLGIYQKGIKVYSENGINKEIDSKKYPTYLGKRNNSIVAEYLYGVNPSNNASNIKFFANSKTSNESIESSIFLRTVKKSNVSSFYTIQKNGNSVVLYKDNQKYANWIASPDPIYCIDEISKNQFLLGSNGKISIISNGKVAKEIVLPYSTPQKIYQVFRDKTGRIWTKDIYGTAYMISPEGKTYLVNELLKLDKTTPIRAFFYDTQDEIVWLGTGSAGLIAVESPFLSNYDLSTISDNSNNILALSIDSRNRLWIGTEKHLNLLNNDHFEVVKDSYHQNISFLQSYDNQILVGFNQIFSSFGQKELATKKHLDQTLIYHSFHPFYKVSTGIYADKENQLFGQNGKIKDANAFFEHCNWQTKSFKLTPEKRLDTRIHPINYFFNRNDTLWVCTERGLFWVINNTCYEPFYGKEINSGAIKKVICDKNGDYYILGEKSLIKWRNGKIITEKKDLNGYKIGAVNDLAIDYKNRLWAGSENGLFFIDKENIYQFDRSNGLSNTSVNSLIYDNAHNCIWIGTSNGLDKLSLDIFARHQFSSPEVIIQRISNLKNVKYSLDNDLKLPYEDNNLKIFLGTNSLQNPSMIQFQYAIDNGQWVNANEIIELASIAFGKHNLSIRAKNRNNTWGKITKFSFTVKTPFYQTWYFIGFVIIGISLFAFWRIRVNNKENSERISLQEQVTELKQQGLAAMMNPHFIFNALNSIQFLVNSENLALANDFLAKFGKLIRMNLDVGSRSTISLNEELTRLELYLSLEKMRFRDKVNYQFEIDAEIDKAETQIPTMMIQPFIENSILHGLAPSKKKYGTIRILFHLKEKRFLCVQIIDDGVGLTKSKQLNISKHVSKGMQIIRERIDLMNKKQGSSQNNNYIKVQELFDENQKSLGTMVEIQFEIEANS